ncbi:hypothetical protein J8F10_15295 [Gemmata sp. G18]|uniref:DUF805 domain-containing protein n=1 Tax=Gemmata palustris TaxID=2822762 RepID=A0ABS5BUR4_9BACT|nr:hypothetical protein [Gemmata palustris]MBP3956638.1 hypothetical protein [Gemmata palustris]
MSPSLVLAQAQGGAPEAFVLFLVVFIIALVLVGLLPQIFYLLTLQKALSRCRRRNRTMEPGMVWLNLIPLFGLVWMFITVSRITESLDNEFYDRGRHRRGEDYGKSLGVAYCSLFVAGVIPYCGAIFSIAGLVCWIMYWVKIAGYSGQLVAREYDDRYDEDDRYADEDDRPAPRRRDRDDERYEDDRPTRRPREDDRYDDEDDNDRGGDRKPWDRGNR